MPRRQITAVVSLALVAAIFLTAQAAAQTVVGQVDFNGSTPGEPLSLLVRPDQGTAFLAGVAGDGRFELPRQAMPLILLPSNRLSMSIDGRPFHIGHLRVQGDEVKPVTLEVDVIPAATITIPVVDALDQPLPGARAAWTLRLPMSDQPDAPAAEEHGPLVRADSEGQLRLRVPSRGPGALTLSTHHVSAHGDLTRGELRVDLATLRKGNLKWKVERLRPSLVVQVAWDPTVDSEPFKPNVRGDPMRHALQLTDVQGSLTAMDENGLVTFYGLPAGNYHLDFSPFGRELYRITNAGPIRIPPNLAQPLRHTLLIQPAKSPVTPATAPLSSTTPADTPPPAQ